jgi:hypothetical protein
MLELASKRSAARSPMVGDHLAGNAEPHEKNAIIRLVALRAPG